MVALQRIHNCIDHVNRLDLLVAYLLDLNAENVTFGLLNEENGAGRRFDFLGGRGKDTLKDGDYQT